MVGIPLGSSSSKGGKSGGYIWGIFLAFFCYCMSFHRPGGVAKQRTLPVEVALWLPNTVFGIAGLFFWFRLELPGDRDLVGAVRGCVQRICQRVAKPFAGTPKVDTLAPSARSSAFSRWSTATYLSGFIFYFVAHSGGAGDFCTDIFHFFDLLGDIVKNHIPMSHVFEYLFFLSPQLIYMLLPISVLVAVLVTFGILTKNNEVTAFKACGVSLMRLGMPILRGSILLSVGLFAFDHYWVPDANLKQDRLRDEIKGPADPEPSGSPAEMDLRPRVRGSTTTNTSTSRRRSCTASMSSNSIPITFDLRGEIAAEQADWQPRQKGLVVPQRARLRPWRESTTGTTGTSRPPLSRNLPRSPELVPDRRHAGQADELPAAAELHPRPASSAVSTRCDCAFSTTRSSPYRCSP